MLVVPCRCLDRHSRHLVTIIVNDMCRCIDNQMDKMRHTLLVIRVFRSSDALVPTSLMPVAIFAQANSIVVNSATMKRKFESADNQESLVDLRVELTGASMGTKNSIARVLSILKAKGKLTDDRLGSESESKALVRSSRKHGDTTTPYGTVVQRTKLDDNYVLPYVHPCAIIYYLTSISKDFATFIGGVLDSQGAKPLSVVVYGDEMTPGNPLRPDAGRTAWQWSFSFVEFQIMFCIRMRGGFISPHCEHQSSAR